MRQWDEPREFGEIVSGLHNQLGAEEDLLVIDAAHYVDGHRLEPFDPTKVAHDEGFTWIGLYELHPAEFDSSHEILDPRVPGQPHPCQRPPCRGRSPAERRVEITTLESAPGCNARIQASRRGAGVTGRARSVRYQLA